MARDGEAPESVTCYPCSEARRNGGGVGCACTVRIDSLFLCGAFTIMKIELRSEELRTIIISLASVCVWLSTVVALDGIELFPCSLAVLCRGTLAFTLSSSCSGLPLRFTHWTSCWCLSGLSPIPAHPMDASQGRHALHTNKPTAPLANALQSSM